MAPTKHIREVGAPVFNGKFGYVPAVETDDQGEHTKEMKRGFLLVERGKGGYNIDKSEFFGADEIMDAVQEKIVGAEQPDETPVYPYRNLIPLQSIINEEIRVARQINGWDTSLDLDVAIEVMEDLELQVQIRPTE
jgi:hypothetical protein